MIETDPAVYEKKIRNIRFKHLVAMAKRIGPVVKEKNIFEILFTMHDDDTRQGQTPHIYPNPDIMQAVLPEGLLATLTPSSLTASTRNM